MKSIAPKNKATPRDTPITSNECLTVSCLEGQVIFLNSKRDSLKKLTSFENINIIPEKESFKSSNDLLKDILNKIIKNFSDNIDKLEEEVNYQEDVTFDEKVNNDPKPIFKLKKELIYLKKALNSNKEVISKMENMEDINIELNQMIDIENTLSSRITAIMEMYMSFTSNKLNETMKSFTVIASLLLLPMLISGIYGMNVILPMQNTEGSFFIILGIMLIFMVSMLIYFKFRKWI